MKRQVGSTLAAIFAIAAFAIGTHLFAGEEDKSVPKGQANGQAAAASDDQKTPDTASVNKRLTLPPGAKLKKNATKEDHNAILKTLEGLTKAAVTKNGFDDVVERFVDADRNRIGKEGATKQKHDDLNALAESLRNLWQQKYGTDLKIVPKDAFTQVATLVGEIEDPQVFAASWPVPPVVPELADAVPAAVKEPARERPNDPDTNIERGRDVAIATFPESAAEHLPALHLSLIHEVTGWRVDIPDQLTGAQLHDSLVRHLQHLKDTEAQWPIKDSVAGLMFARHVTMAVYGVDVPKPADKEKHARGNH